MIHYYRHPYLLVSFILLVLLLSLIPCFTLYEPLQVTGKGFFILVIWWMDMDLDNPFEFDDLPDDIIGQIACYLSRSDICALAMVCSWFYFIGPFLFIFYLD